MSNAKVFETVTNSIIEALENGAAPWRKTWAGSPLIGFGQHVNATNGRAYRGLNTIILSMAATAAGYRSTGWITPRQAMAHGLSFKGQRCTVITFWKRSTRTVADAVTGDDVEKQSLLMRTYLVLNLDQCEGDKSKLRGNAVDAVPVIPMERHALAGAIECGLSLTVRHGGDRAFYAPAFDVIQMPERSMFESDGAYCATLTHEGIHATGANHRLAREFGKRFGDDAYAAEELVAELGAAFVGAVTGHSDEVPNHASYLASWLRILKGDSKAILTVASKAQAAADLVLSAIGAEEGDDEELPQAA